MPKEDYIPVCEYDQKHKCDGTRWCGEDEIRSPIYDYRYTDPGETSE